MTHVTTSHEAPDREALLHAVEEDRRLRWSELRAAIDERLAEITRNAIQAFRDAQERRP